MYANHVPIIAAAMRADVECFARGVMFAILSVRVQFPRVPDQCKELETGKAKARCLWGWKFDAYAYVQEHKQTLLNNVLRDPDIASALWEITRIPGMGIVKGAFVLQLMGFDIACLDTRNIQREGRSPRAYRADGEGRKSTKAFRAKINRYIADTGGKAQQYWDTWCTEVAADYKSTPDAISKMHLTSIVPHALRYLTMTVPVDTAIPF